ncbi:AMP-dependent synthetase/ligase [Corynebacterium sp. MNWGS58]|uniref:AMP-dependent synthetase/ligase n=1 Tax=Corynebacterium sp. 102791.4 TaxID=3104612 RepID=UPI003510F6D7
MREAFSPAKYTIEPGQTLLTLTIDAVKSQPKAEMFSRPKNHTWVPVSRQEFLDEVYAVAKGLIDAGVGQGDRVALMANTRYEWMLVNYAIWAAGGIVVPIYPSSSLSQVQWIIENSGAVLGIGETQEHTEILRMLQLADDGQPRLKDSSSQMRAVYEINDGAVAALTEAGKNIADELVDKRIAATATDDVASLVYTSGTTGRPKGCMLTHRNWNAQILGLLTNPIGGIAHAGKHVLTFLPLAHVLAFSVSAAGMISGPTQNFWGDFATLPTEFQRSKPNLILGVPRVFEKVRNGARAKAHDAGPIQGALFDRAEATAIAYSRALDTENGPSFALRSAHKALDKLVLSKIRAGMGGEVDYCISGGSAMSTELMHFFRGIGVPIYEGYGLTETAAAATVDFEDQKIGTVGPPLGGMRVRVAGDGELQLCGDLVFDGYWRNSDATDEAFDGQWYCTGDLGEILPSGHVKIVGRKKDLIVTAGGKNVAPGGMEDELRSHPLISQALVVGDGKPFVGVLVTLDEGALARWKSQHNIDASRSVSELVHDASLRAEVQDAVNAANATVSHAEAIKKFYILTDDFTEESGELTPTMKVKRNVVVERYADALEQLYSR